MRSAVAAIFVYKGHLLNIIRQTSLAAFPGFTAFPGGKIDEGDEQHAIEHPLLSHYPSVEIGALIREIREELGFDLADALHEEQVLSISKFGSAMTPPDQKHRFNIHFYKIELSSKPTLELNKEEVNKAQWMTPSDLLTRYHSGQAMIVSATLAITRALAENTDATTADINPTFHKDQLPILPFIHDVNQIFVPSNTLPPATATNALLVGDEGALRILTDPSPASKQVLQTLKNTLDGKRPDALFLSHHHPDHHERLPQLARDWGIPVLCSKQCETRLLSRFGDDYLVNVEIQHVKQGDVITQWQGEEVICHELAGHDDSMVGLAPESLAWFYVADLVEPGTTVVIPEPEGDMAVYFDSLKRVIAMQPKHIIPSHGLPVLGTELLSQTLAHREAREQQILDAYHSGLRDDALLEALYPRLAEKLIPYAAQNIRQHLRKLGLYSEGKAS
ncbi:NUDIX domain-containing protein [Leucothrix sargassi]|nr:NUDIX domain-containing protein [Leucothrix sargassi]